MTVLKQSPEKFGLLCYNFRVMQEILQNLRKSIELNTVPKITENEMAFVMQNNFLAGLYFDCLDFVENSVHEKNFLINRIDTLISVTKYIYKDLWPMVDTSNSEILSFEISHDQQAYIINSNNIKSTITNVLNKFFEHKIDSIFFSEYKYLKEYFVENKNESFLGLVLAILDAYLFFGKEIKNNKILNFVHRKLV